MKKRKLNSKNPKYSKEKPKEWIRVLKKEIKNVKIYFLWEK
tara:strand:+ start:180 stop:302 length:123 start_codon:yes stop_codon:yes gene_type:complete